jgi:hypothetical protein
MEENVIKIFVGDTVKFKPKKKEKKESQSIKFIQEKLLEYEEISFKYLKHLHGSWIKCLNLQKTKLFSGGFITGISEFGDSVYLRCPSKGDSGAIEISKNDHTFYVKGDNENWKSLKFLLEDHEKELWMVVTT